MNLTSKIMLPKLASFVPLLKSANFQNLPLVRSLHVTSSLRAEHWLSYNDVIYPPQKEGEERRLAFVCHERNNIKYSPWKMWYVASLIRGMRVDEAIRQLKFVNKKGATHVREVLEEAKELAVKEHNVEFPSNMWVAESMVGKGFVLKGMRRHARRRVGIVEYFHCNYFVRLEEGKPPKHYYQNHPVEPQQQLDQWLIQMRKRKIINSL